MLRQSQDTGWTFRCSHHGKNLIPVSELSDSNGLTGNSTPSGVLGSGSLEATV